MTPRVLLLLTQPGQRALLRDALEYAGFTAICAEDTLECLLKVSFERPDLVIAEDDLPVLGAPDLAAAIRQRRGGAEVPIILLSRRPQAAGALVEPTGPAMRLSPPLRIGRVVQAARSLLAPVEGPAAPEPRRERVGAAAP